MHFISHPELGKFLLRLAKVYQVFVPSKANDVDYDYTLLKENFKLNPYRNISSIRQFFSPSAYSLGGYFKAQNNTSSKPLALVGVKNCDLHSLKVQDYVFLEGDFTDEDYKKRRENNLIISSDCSGFKDVCFCLAIGLDPYPEEGYDLNLSETKEGFLVDVGSEKGSSILSSNKDLFHKKDAVQERQGVRKKIVEELAANLLAKNLVPHQKLYQLIKQGYNHDTWSQEALRCVECGACIMNCPTCHCFLLIDEEIKNGYFRGRIWDGCQYRDFTRVAGGANPLMLRTQRLRNRYIKKFEFFKERIDLYACTGCGRCIECCPAKIDLREIFKKLYQGSKEVV